MSTNIHFEATREIIVVKTGQRDVQTTCFDAWQTSTRITFTILESEDPIQEYKKWVLSITEDREELFYAEDDIFCEQEPIGSRIVNDGRDHVAEFETWLSAMEQNGWAVKGVAW